MYVSSVHRQVGEQPPHLVPPVGVVDKDGAGGDGAVGVNLDAAVVAQINHVVQEDAQLKDAEKKIFDIILL